MSLSVVCRRRQVIIGDGMMQRRMYRRLVTLLPQQLAGVERGRRRGGQVQQGRRWASAVAVRHAAPLALLHRTRRAAWTDPAHSRVGPIVRISRAHYHTVVLLGGHGAGNTIRARTHFTLHFTLTRLHFLLFHALVGFLTDLDDITCTHTFSDTCNNWNKLLIKHTHRQKYIGTAIQGIYIPANRTGEYIRNHLSKPRLPVKRN